VNDTAAIEHLAELLGPSYGVLDYVPDWGFRLPDPWPAVMRIDVTTFGQKTRLEMATIYALATTRVHVTPGLLKWFAGRTNSPVHLGAHRLWPYVHEQDFARVLISWSAPVFEISQHSLEAVIQNIGQQAGNSAIQLLQIFGAEVPSDY